MAAFVPVPSPRSFLISPTVPETIWLFSQPDDVTTTAGGDYVDRQALANLGTGLGVLLGGVEAAIAERASASRGGLTGK